MIVGKMITLNTVGFCFVLSSIISLFHLFVNRGNSYGIETYTLIFFMNALTAAILFYMHYHMENGKEEKKPRSGPQWL
jgi:hypothetical protein